MKIARKLAIALVLGIGVVMAAYAALQVHQEVKLFESDVARVQRIGRFVMTIIREVWASEGEARVRELVQQGDKGVPEVGFRVVGLDPAGTDPPPARLSALEQRMLQNGNYVVLRDDAEDGGPWRYTYVPIGVAGKFPAAVEVRESLQRQLTYIRMGHFAILAAALAVALVCGLIASALQYRYVGRPLQRLRDKALRAGRGDFSGPVRLRQNDEIGELAASVNLMCDQIAAANRRAADEATARIAALEQMRHTDRLATVGQLAAGVAHELGTPLNVVSARAQLIATTEMPRTEYTKHALVVVEQADRMTEIIQQLLDFSRRRPAAPALVSLHHVVIRTLDMLSSVAQKARVQLLSDAPEQPVLAYVDQNRLQQALTNIVLNAIQSMPKGGAVRVTTSVQAARPPGGDAHADYACVSVEDQGKGIAPEQIAHVFEPFFTTKEVGEGTGLGLAVAHGIVTEHGGWITVESEMGKGSRFVMHLPQPAAARPQDLEVAS